MVDSTCELLELQGYHGTGLREILRASGAPKGSLYHHFPGGKNELTVAALSTVAAIVRDRIEGALAGADPVSVAVPRFIRDIARNVEQSGFRAGGPITTVALETAATNPAIRAECARIYGEWRAVFASRLERDGYSHDAAAGLAATIVAAIEGGIILCRCDQRVAALENVATGIEILLRASALPAAARDERWKR